MASCNFGKVWRLHFGYTDRTSFIRRKSLSERLEAGENRITVLADTREIKSFHRISVSVIERHLTGYVFHFDRNLPFSLKSCFATILAAPLPFGLRLLNLPDPAVDLCELMLG